METIWVLPDQLYPDQSALASATPATARVLLLESHAWLARRRYHRHRSALIVSAMRHFAQELGAAGWQVDHHRFEDTPDHETALKRHVARWKPSRIRLMEPSDEPTQSALPVWSRRVGVAVEAIPGNQFLMSRDAFRHWAGSSRSLRMENHYRRLRRELGILMTPENEPEGGTWNFDHDNRRTHREWQSDGCPLPRSRSQVIPDALDREVLRSVAQHFPDHPGAVDDFWLPTTRRVALEWLRHFVEERLPGFGPYEDLMVEGNGELHHSILTPTLNLGLLRPLECVNAAVEAYRRGKAPLSSVEGFVRQLIGWREFINGVYWLRMPGYESVNELGARESLPTWFHSGKTRMQCVRSCLEQVLGTGFNHHIQRLMVLGNYLLVRGVEPGQALEWFNEMYVDAHEWVMAANVLGMSQFADGGFMATKPYAAGSAYIRKMSNHCQGCRYDPDQKTGPDACPFNYLYWDFIARHEERWARNPRMAVMVSAWRKKPESERAAVRESARVHGLAGEG